jgi:anti-sigma factor RsiW
MSEICRVDEKMINRYLDDELSVSKRKDFERRLRSDPALRELLNGYRRILKSLRAFRRVKFPPGRVRETRTLILQRVSALS